MKYQFVSILALFILSCDGDQVSEQQTRASECVYNVSKESGLENVPFGTQESDFLNSDASVAFESNSEKNQEAKKRFRPTHEYNARDLGRSLSLFFEINGELLYFVVENPKVCFEDHSIIGLSNREVRTTLESLGVKPRSGDKGSLYYSAPNKVIYVFTFKDDRLQGFAVTGPTI